MLPARFHAKFNLPAAFVGIGIALTLSIYGNSGPPFLTGEVNSANAFGSGFIAIRRLGAQFISQSKFNIK